MRTKRTVTIDRVVPGLWTATGADGQQVVLRRRNVTEGTKLHTYWIAEPPGTVARTLELLLAELVRQGILEAE